MNRELKENIKNKFLKKEVKIFYFMSGYPLKDPIFNKYIKSKYSVIDKTFSITINGQDKHAVNIILKELIEKEDFNNIINSIIEYHKDENIIFFYKSGKEEANKKYTFSNIIKVKNKQAINEDTFRSDSEDEIAV